MFIKTTKSLFLCVVMSVVASTSHAVEFTAGDYELEVYGFLRMDAAFDVDDDLGPANQHDFDAIRRPGGTPAPEGHFDMSANSSRLGFALGGPDGAVGRVEGDFYYGDFRLRHAYAAWNGVLFGQTWSNFNSLLATTGKLARGGPSGRAGFVRKTQLRYTFELDGGELAFSMEDPTGGIQNEEARRPLPDLTARFQNKWGPLTYSSSVLLRRVRYDLDNGEDEPGTGYGISLAARYPVTASTLLKASLTYGEGIGNYLSKSPAPVSFIDRAGKLKAIKQIGYVVAMKQRLSQRLSTNLAYARGQADWDEAENAEAIDPATVHKTHTSMYANLVYQATKHLSYGFEVARHGVVWQDGVEEEATRLLLVGHYDF